MCAQDISLKELKEEHAAHSQEELLPWNKAKSMEIPFHPIHPKVDSKRTSTIQILNENWHMEMTLLLLRQLYFKS